MTEQILNIDMKQMKDSELYAPVYIPTLNRFEHLRQCLESLEKCSGADKTDVFVGLDYPPSEKYVDGWKKIDQYLAEKEKNNGFHNLFVRRRTENCGVGKAGSNFILLTNEVRDAGYPYYIFTEDDNVFSYRFLEYVNRGLKKYENDKSVFAICGYLHPNKFSSEEDATVVMMPEFAGWGYGRWFNRVDSTIGVTPKELLSSKEIRSYFRKNRPEIYAALLWMVKNNRVLGDSFFTAFLHQSKQKCVFPLTTLVVNKGWDGTGIHGGIVEAYSNQVGEPEIHDEFVFKPLSPEEEKRHHQVYLRYWKNYDGILKTLCYRFMFFMYETFGIIITVDDFKKIKRLFH